MSANVLHHYALLDIDRWKRPVLTRPGATHPRAGRWNSGAETHKQIARVLERLEIASGSGPFDTALVNVNDLRDACLTLARALDRINRAHKLLQRRQAESDT